MSKKVEYATLAEIINGIANNNPEHWYQIVGIDLNGVGETEYIQQHQGDFYRVTWPDHVVNCRYNSDASFMLTSMDEAIKEIPGCVELEQMDGTWEHYVFRVEHCVDIYINEGEDIYTNRDALACQKWLKEYAPMNRYAKVSLNES